MRVVTITANRALHFSEIRGDCIVFLAPGVSVSLPGGGADGVAHVKATGSGCAITSTAGIESPTATGPTHTVSSRSLASMESLVLAADSGTPWRIAMGFLPRSAITSIAEDAVDAADIPGQISTGITSADIPGQVSTAITSADISGQISTAITTADIPGQIVTELSDAGLAGAATPVTTASPSAVGAGVYEIDTTTNAVDLPLVASDGAGDAFITVTWVGGSNTAKLSPASGNKVGHDLATNGEFTFSTVGQSVVLRNSSSGVWSQV